MGIRGEVLERQSPVRMGVYTTINSSITYRVGILGPTDHELSLRNFYSQDSVEQEPELANSISDFVRGLGGTRIFGPTVRFSRHVVTAQELTTRIELPGGMLLYRNKHIAADAVTLPEVGDAMLMSGGGCAQVVMVCGKNMVAGHGGRDALVDRDYVLMQTELDTGSIVDAMAKIVSDNNRFRLRKASCRAFYSVPRKAFDHQFDHPEHGRYNRELSHILRARYDGCAMGMVVNNRGGFYLDQGQLIGAQAKRHGFHTISTCLLPLKERGPYVHTRHRNPAMRDKRNLIAVVRLT